jgi:hypothetical protein
VHHDRRDVLGFAKREGNKRIHFCSQLKAHNSMLKVIENNCKSENSHIKLLRFLAKAIALNKCSSMTLSLPSSIILQEIQFRGKVGTIACCCDFLRLRFLIKLKLLGIMGDRNSFRRSLKCNLRERRKN